MTNSEILKEIADKLGLKLKKSRVLGIGAILEIKELKGFNVKLYCHPQWINIEMKIKSEFTVAFNQDECSSGTPIALNEYPCRLFTNTPECREQIVKFANLVSPLIQELDLKNIESIAIYGKQLSSDARHVDKGSEIKKEINDLPDHLKDLYFLFPKWAISDDLERDELIDAMSIEEINYLMETVGYRISDINSYLDSFGDGPLTEKAQQIASLAELVSELKNRK